jgi:hypothetical protein
MENKEFDFEPLKKQAIAGMYEGKPLNGEKGIFAPLLKHFQKPPCKVNYTLICRRKSQQVLRIEKMVRVSNR